MVLKCTSKVFNLNSLPAIDTRFLPDDSRVARDQWGFSYPHISVYHICGHWFLLKKAAWRISGSYRNSWRLLFCDKGLLFCSAGRQAGRQADYFEI
jgi:hypothetical protein